MLDLTELKLILNVVGEEIRAYLITAYPWLSVAVLTAFSVINSLRVLAYVPQILKAARDNNGATAISMVTWGLFFLSHLTTIAYAIVSLGDMIMALIFLGNAFACLLILLITVYKRKHPSSSSQKNT